MTHKISETLKEALFEIGRAIPESVEQIDLFEKHAKKNNIPELPKAYKTASEILKLGELTIINNIERQIFRINDSQEGMARAAREGKKENFSEEVLRKMKIDRDNAENKKK